MKIYINIIKDLDIGTTITEKKNYIKCRIISEIKQLNIWYGYINKNDKYLIDGWYYSISYSKNIVIYAISRSKIGIDIELLEPNNYAVIPKGFSKIERIFIERFTYSERMFHILMIWTKKESLLKVANLNLESIESISVIDNELKYLNAYIINGVKIYVKTFTYLSYIISISISI